jgi:subtilisin family serine protease
MTLNKSLTPETLAPQKGLVDPSQQYRPSEADPRQPDNAPAELEHNPNEVIIKFKSGVQTAEVNTLQSNLRATTLETTRTLGTQLWQIEGMTADEAVAAYANDPRVEYIVPNYLRSLAQTPDDPSFGQLWGLNNTGQTGGTPDADIDAPEAWDLNTGESDVVVGVIDTGVDYNHPDLAANIWTNPGEVAGDGIDNDNNGYIDDIHGYDFSDGDSDPFDDDGHGTHVSGTIGAVGDNGTGVVGANWSAQIMALKIFPNATDFNIIQAIEYSANMGVKITNNSWGGGPPSEALEDAIAYAGSLGQLFIAAAGNGGFDGIGDDNDIAPEYPASFDLDNIIAVAATDHNDNLANFSNYGETTVDLGAPGVSVYSTLPGNNYGFLSGTSMATPHVSGVAALLLSQYPDLTAAEVKETLLGTVDPIAALEGITVTGGRLNAYNALLGPVAASISGTKWNDLNGDGTRDANEPGLANWTIYLDADNDGTLDDGETSTVTDADGNYAFKFLASGDYTVAEVQKPGWTQTSSPETYNLNVAENQDIENIDFGNQLTNPASISGRKWNDVDRDGIQDNGESVLSGWTIYLDTNKNGELDDGELSDITDANGEYSFENLSPDTYTVAEVQQPGWTQTSPVIGTLGEVFNADFSDASGNPDLDGFTIDNTGGGVAGLWHLSTGRGNQPGHSAADSLYFGTGEGVDGGGNYDVGHTAGRITSPVIDLTSIGGAELSFNYFLASEGGNPWDSARVLISQDGGVFEAIASNVSEFVDPTTGWTNATVDLTPYTGSNIEIRFDFDTIDSISNTFEGWYVDDIVVTEVGKGTHTLELNPDETATDINFGNAELEPGEIHGYKWNDEDGDGEWDDNESALSGWTIFLDDNQNGELDEDEPSDITDANGEYSFTELVPGTYTVAEVQQEGWTQTSPIASQVFDDPQGDPFGFGDPQLDIESVSAGVSGGTLNLTMNFFTPIAAPSTGLANSVVGYWDLDLDQDPTTGIASSQSFFAPPDQQGGLLGVDAYISLFSESVHPGLVDIIDSNTFATIGSVPITYDSDAIEIQVPLSLLGDDGMLNYSTIAGTFSEPTDAAPNSEFGTLGDFSSSPTSVSSTPVPSIQRVWGAAIPFVTNIPTPDGSTPTFNDLEGTNNTSLPILTNAGLLAFPGVHTVDVGDGEIVNDVNFGNQQIVPGEIHGIKWNDLDGDGTQDEDEPGLEGWTIYLDDNQNGQLDVGEESTLTDANGEYEFTNLDAGTYTVAEEQQSGWEQTYPSSPLPNGNFETGNLTNWETIGVANIESSDFGSGPVEGTSQAFLSNTNGAVSDANLESFLGLTPGSLDSLGNGNATEGSALKRTITVSAGDQLTFDWNFLTNEGTPSSFNDFAFISIGTTDSSTLASTNSSFVPSSTIFPSETGFGTFSHTFTTGGTYTLGLGVLDVADTVADSGLLIDNVSVNVSTHTVELSNGEIVTDIDFGNQEQRGTISGSKWSDLDGDGTRDTGEPGLANWTIYLDDNNNGLLDTDETSTTTDELGNYSFSLEAGTYTVAEVLEPEWVQTYPVGGTHTVELDTAEDVTNIDFGNRPAINVITGTSGNDSLSGTPIPDDISGLAGNDVLRGQQDDDILRGGGGNDSLYGGADEDDLLGNAGNDLMYGGKGNDTLRGGAGADVLTGVNVLDALPGLGEIDRLTGNADTDTFALGDASKVYYDDGNNTNSGVNDYGLIVDFSVGTDIIQLRGNASNYVLATSAVGLPPGTAIFRETGTTDELIGIVRNIPLNQLNLTTSSFSYI